MIVIFFEESLKPIPDQHLKLKVDGGGGIALVHEILAGYVAF